MLNWTWTFLNARWLDFLSLTTCLKFSSSQKITNHFLDKRTVLMAFVENTFTIVRHIWLTVRRSVPPWSIRVRHYIRHHKLWYKTQKPQKRKLHVFGSWSEQLTTNYWIFQATYILIRYYMGIMWHPLVRPEIYTKIWTYDRIYERVERKQIDCPSKIECNQKRQFGKADVTFCGLVRKISFCQLSTFRGF